MEYDIRRALEANKGALTERHTEQGIDFAEGGNLDVKLDRNNTPYQDIDRLSGLLQRTGIPTFWERSFPCPCMSSTGYPKIDCAICHGKGIAFEKPNILQVAYQSNQKAPVSNEYGVNDIGTTIATPAPSENGIEEGISFRDRLTIRGMTIHQSFLFNVTDRRVANGMFIPYHVLEFNHVVSMDNNGQLVVLEEGRDFEYEPTTSMFYAKDRLIGRNISMVIATWLRYYVSDVLKETRYAQVKKLQDKEVALGKGNQLLTNYMEKYSQAIQPGTMYNRMTKKLVLKREDLFIGATNFEDTDHPNRGEFTDTKDYDNDIMGMFHTGGSD